MAIVTVISTSKKEISVVVERKKMKTCRLKVFPSMEVKISVPQGTSDEWITAYLNDKADWIETKLDVFSRTSGYASTTQIKNGMSIKMLGQDMLFSLKESKKDYVFAEHKIIHIGTASIDNQDKVLAIFDKWWRTEATTVYTEHLERLYPIVGKYDIDKPTISVKKMKTLWGSCSVKRGVITINQYLLKARPACIEYVILHELVHLLCPNHSKSFYDFLGTHMPDWKERKRILDFDVVHGL